MQDQSLFSTPKAQKSLDSQTPLAHRARPRSLEEFFGQEELFSQYPILRQGKLSSLILWGPPGSGKTTLANLLAQKAQMEIYVFSAVLGGLADLRKLIARAKEIQELYAKRPLIFIDEIHRFNKAQQDALLPYVESGEFTLIGATTENPRVTINRALLSRVRPIELKALSTEALKKILSNVGQRFELHVSEEILQLIAEFCSGDARKAIGALELVHISGETQVSKVKRDILENARDYDKNQNRHYDVISAFIKSMRGSDPDAALLWLAVMLDGGEDPVFIARRLVIFASEDVGNADPRALSLAIAGLQAVQNIGMPEARINLGQVTSYLAATVKSNAAYTAINEAMEYVAQQSTISVPDHLKSHPPKEAPPYKYPHSFPGHYVEQRYTVEKIPKFYRATEQGQEKFLKHRLEELTKSRQT